MFLLALTELVPAPKYISTPATGIPLPVVALTVTFVACCSIFDVTVEPPLPVKIVLPPNIGSY